MVIVKKTPMIISQFRIYRFKSLWYHNIKIKIIEIINNNHKMATITYYRERFISTMITLIVCPRKESRQWWDRDKIRWNKEENNFYRSSNRRWSMIRKCSIISMFIIDKKEWGNNIILNQNINNNNKIIPHSTIIISTTTNIITTTTPTITHQQL